MLTGLQFDDSFVNELPRDENEENTPRQVEKACFSFVSPKQTAAPELIVANASFALQLGLSEADVGSEEFLKVFSGNKVVEGTTPYAMCYGGHQFGNWAGQLGDGRAINLFEVIHQDQRWAVQLKGAGPTPYSRTADGLAVLRSSIREYLCSEAMYALGVPTTRALSLMESGDKVWRDVMYDGNAAFEKGAIVSRVAPSFLRFGNFQLLTARQDVETLRILTDYTIRHFYPELGEPSKQSYIDFFQAITDKTLEMVIHWQRVGFVHGVMNTDNMSILGLTIDYGPYGWQDDYDKDWTPNTTDRQHRRYRFGQQPQVALWNLFQLANALYPLIEETAPLEAVLDSYKAAYQKQYYGMMLQKIGLTQVDKEDKLFIQSLEETLSLSPTDMTIFFRLLANAKKDMKASEVLELVSAAFYEPNDIKGEILTQWKSWLSVYITRLQLEPQTDEQRKAVMNKVNPKYVLRNYMAQLAIEQAEKGDYTLVRELEMLLKAPYDEQAEFEKWFVKRPDWAKNKVGCSMLSCSS